MARKWKNSDDVTYYTDKAMHNRLERLRKELIPGYADKNKRPNKPTFGQKNRNRKKNK